MKKLPKITYKEPMALAKWSVWDSNRKCAWGTDSLIHAIKYWLIEMKKYLKAICTQPFPSSAASSSA